MEKRLADVCRAIAMEKASGTLVEPRTVVAEELEAIRRGPSFVDAISAHISMPPDMLSSLTEGTADEGGVSGTRQSQGTEVGDGS